MRIGFTGHQRLKSSADWDWVRQEVNSLLASFPKPLIGICSLAIGADQLFAEAVLQHRGSIEIVVPFPSYESSFAEGADREAYHSSLKKASRVEILERAGTQEEAYFAAGKRVVDLADLVIAVWNGKPAAGPGGTADVVNYARHNHKRTVHLNPDLKAITS